MRTSVFSSSRTRGWSCAIAARRSSAFMGPERYPMARASRPEAFEPPPAARARVAEPVVEAMLPPLPELDGRGFEAVPAPARRQRDLVPREAGLEPGERGLELLPGRAGRLCSDAHAPIRASRGRLRK